MNKLALMIFTLFLCLPAGWSAGTVPGDAARGAALFKQKQCVGCHAIQGEGGDSASDLAVEPSGRFTPTILANAIWNNGPAMWSAMESAGMDKQSLSTQEAADLFAYLYSFRYFEDAGDVETGRHVFDSKGCIGCHSQGTGGATPVMSWSAMDDPVQLARAMWNHAPEMKEALPPGDPWPELTAQQMADLLAYVRDSMGGAEPSTDLGVASATTGETLFREKGCAGCHTGAQALRGKTGARTMTELASAMWNHAPEMRDKAQALRPEEMTRLVGYLWSVQYFEGEGDPAKGLQVATARGCIGCHGDPKGTTPRFSAYSGKMDPIRFIAGTWNHSIGMQAEMDKAGMRWPVLDKTSLLNLFAYINSL